jgi:hypothetical protein
MDNENQYLKKNHPKTFIMSCHKIKLEMCQNLWASIMDCLDWYFNIKLVIFKFYYVVNDRVICLHLLVAKKW